MAKKWRGLLHALSILIFFSENAPFLVCGSLEYQISHPRLQASYFLPGNNEFVLSKKGKERKIYTKVVSLTDKRHMVVVVVFFQYDVVVCQAAERVSKSLLLPDTWKIL